MELARIQCPSAVAIKSSGLVRGLMVRSAASAGIDRNPNATAIAPKIFRVHMNSSPRELLFRFLYPERPQGGAARRQRHFRCQAAHEKVLGAAGAGHNR